ncbi:hypothetical protein FOZ62_006940 [Perkinsus olseni]|uniref:Uncharacterized protein n=1 Tax=Perkinsus olseni TaxID=32597 RepID=A0A7J6TX62_PEROL|nr:hypothetical protein FOZ62_006940 [Perkinsus olseni]
MRICCFPPVISIILLRRLGSIAAKSYARRRRFSVWTDKYTNASLSEIVHGGESGISPHTLILLNDVENPGVVASVIRNCHLLGASAVILGTTRGFNYTQSFVKTCLRHSMAYCFGGPHVIAGVESTKAATMLSDSYGYTVGSLCFDATSNRVSSFTI